MTPPLIILAVWLCCAVLCYGIQFALSAHEWDQGPITPDTPRPQDMAVGAFFFGMFMGPLGLMITFFLCECAKHGLKFK